MKVLIIKLGATGDVIRTTTLLRVLNGEIHWLTSDLNTIMLYDNNKIKRCIPWSKASNLFGDKFDLIINLEDRFDTAQMLNQITYKDLFGVYLNNSDKLSYTENSKEWFDLSLISRFGKEQADKLKLDNRKSYQDIVFSGLGYLFKDEAYFIPQPRQTELKGDVAIAPKSGNIWPMKDWAYFDELKEKLEKLGFKVNYLPIRRSLLNHIGDIKNHRYLISGDSLPMHIALGSGIMCLTIFICTSPWEIFDYGVQKKIVSPLLEKYFYKRTYDARATASISVDTVLSEFVRLTEQK